MEGRTHGLLLQPMPENFARLVHPDSEAQRSRRFRACPGQLAIRLGDGSLLFSARTNCVLFTEWPRYRCGG